MGRVAFRIVDSVNTSDFKHTLIIQVGWFVQRFEFRSDWKNSSSWAYFDGDDTSVIVGEVWRKKVLVSGFRFNLSSCTIGVEEVVKVALGSTNSFVSIGVTCFDFGLPIKDTDPGWGVWPTEMRSGHVLDVELLEAHEVKTTDLVFSVAHSQYPAYHSMVYKQSVHGHLVMQNEDCTFLVRPMDPWIQIAAFRKGEHVGSAKLEMKRPGPRAQWIPLLKEGGSIALWLRLRIQVSLEEEQSSFLSHLGTPTAALPMRVNVGDVILIDNASLAARLISVGTGSRYDHVCLVVAAGPHDVLSVLDASKVGCYAYPFEERVRTVLAAGSRLALRRITHVERDDRFLTAMRTFVTENEGKPYEKMTNLIKAKFRINQSDELEQLFCSEVVAGALKVVDVIDKDRVSSNYLPKDFAKPQIPGMVRGTAEPLKYHALTDPTSPGINKLRPPRRRYSSEDGQAIGNSLNPRSPRYKRPSSTTLEEPMISPPPGGHPPAPPPLAQPSRSESVGHYPAHVRHADSFSEPVIGSSSSNNNNNNNDQ